MIQFKANLAAYIAARHAICEMFFAAVDKAEIVCDNATHSANTNFVQDAAQVAFGSQIRVAKQTRTAAIEALGPPPVM